MERMTPDEEDEEATRREKIYKDAIALVEADFFGYWAPRHYPIDEDVVKRWAQIPNEAKVSFVLTKAHLDGLFFAYAQMSETMRCLMQAVSALADGDRVEAIAQAEAASTIDVSALTSFRIFFEGVMATAKVSDD